MYLLLVNQIDAGCARLLWIGQNRTVKTLLGFFRMFGKENAARLKNICADMWKVYHIVIKKKVPWAIHIVDRFHSVSMINKAIDEVRATYIEKCKKKVMNP